MERCQLQQDFLQQAPQKRRSQSNKAHIWRRQLTNLHGFLKASRNSINNQAPAQQYNITTGFKVLGIRLKLFLPQHADGPTRIFVYKIEQLPKRLHRTLRTTR